MKQLLKTFLVAVLIITGTKAAAQTEAETLEWLKVKQNEISAYHCYSSSLQVGDKSVEFTDGQIKLIGNAGGYTNIGWDNIKDLKFEGEYKLTIVSNTVSSTDTNKIYITLDFKTSDQPAKFEKAIRHMAELKGATFIKDDLFGE